MADTLGSAYYAAADSGLVAYWRFDQFEDLGVNADGVDDLRDLSPTLAHGDTMGEVQLVSWEVGIGGSGDETPEMPEGLALGRNHPNPFGLSTVIPSSCPQGQGSHTTLSIYDVAGRLVRRFTASDLGRSCVIWDGSNSSGGRVPNGIYFCELRTGAATSAKQRLVLLR
jgi:hypothetical protein